MEMIPQKYSIVQLKFKVSKHLNSDFFMQTSIYAI